MNEEKVLRSLSTIKEYTDRSNILAHEELDKLMEGLRQDIAIKAAKQAGNVSQHRALLTFAKYCQKHMKDIRPVMAGAYILGERQCICDGYRAVIKDDPEAGLPLAEDGEPFNLDKIFPDSTYGYSRIIIPRLDDLKAENAVGKAENKNDKGYYHKTTLRAIGEAAPVCVNTDYLINMIECIGDGVEIVTEIKPSLNGWSLNPLIFTGDGIKGILLPIRPAEKASNVA